MRCVAFPVCGGFAGALPTTGLLLALRGGAGKLPRSCVPCVGARRGAWLSSRLGVLVACRASCRVTSSGGLLLEGGSLGTVGMAVTGLWAATGLPFGIRRSVANGLSVVMEGLCGKGLSPDVVLGSIGVCALVAGRSLGSIVAAGWSSALRLGADAAGSVVTCVPGLGGTRWTFG